MSSPEGKSKGDQSGIESSPSDFNDRGKLFYRKGLLFKILISNWFTGDVTSSSMEKMQISDDSDQVN